MHAETMRAENMQGSACEYTENGSQSCLQYNNVDLHVRLITEAMQTRLVANRLHFHPQNLQGHQGEERTLPAAALSQPHDPARSGVPNRGNGGDNSEKEAWLIGPLHPTWVVIG